MSDEASVHPVPVLWLVAGPDGVGKTTYAFRHIRDVSGSVHFINVDEIARGLSPLDRDVARRPAARVAIRRIRELVSSGSTLSLETTLAGVGHLDTMTMAREAGFQTRLLYFSVRDVETCLTRIARRVAEGGHDVPTVDIRRRFERSVANFARYAALADIWRVFDANGNRPYVVAEGRRTCITTGADLDGLPDRLASTIAGFDR